MGFYSFLGMRGDEGLVTLGVFQRCGGWFFKVDSGEKPKQLWQGVGMCSEMMRNTAKFLWLSD